MKSKSFKQKVDSFFLKVEFVFTISINYTIKGIKRVFNTLSKAF